MLVYFSCCSEHCCFSIKHISGNSRYDKNFEAVSWVSEAWSIFYTMLSLPYFPEEKTTYVAKIFVPKQNLNN